MLTNTTAAAAPNVWKTLQGFIGAFLQFAKGNFHLATSSFGGQYGPLFSSYFLKENAKNIPRAIKINLKSVLIRNGLIDLKTINLGYYHFSLPTENTYDYDPYNGNDTIKKQLYKDIFGPGGCYDLLDTCKKTWTNKDCFAADQFCAGHTQQVWGNSDRNAFNIQEKNPGQVPYGYYEAYLNTPKVLKALGASTNWSPGSNTVSTAFAYTGESSRDTGTIPACRKLVEAGVQVLLFYGDADYVANWLGGQAVSNIINTPGFSTAGYTNITTCDDKVHGQVKQSGLFAFSRIYNAGHNIPFFQPQVALDYFERAIHGLDIATGTVKVTKDYKTVGTQVSTYRQGKAGLWPKALPEHSTYNIEKQYPDKSPQWATYDYGKKA